MPKTLLDVLQTLLASPDDTTISVTPPGDWGPYGEVEALPDAVDREMGRAVAQIASLWGPPAFHGYWGEEGFPFWTIAYDVVACWPREGRFLYLGCNAGSEMPVVLKFTVNEIPHDS